MPGGGAGRRGGRRGGGARLHPHAHPPHAHALRLAVARAERTSTRWSGAAERLSTNEHTRPISMGRLVIRPPSLASLYTVTGVHTRLLKRAAPTIVSLAAGLRQRTGHHWRHTGQHTHLNSIVHTSTFMQISLTRLTASSLTSHNRYTHTSSRRENKEAGARYLHSTHKYTEREQQHRCPELSRLRSRRLLHDDNLASLLGGLRLRQPPPRARARARDDAQREADDPASARTDGGGGQQRASQHHWGGSSGLSQAHRHSSSDPRAHDGSISTPNVSLPRMLRPCAPPVSMTRPKSLHAARRPHGSRAAALTTHTRATAAPKASTAVPRWALR